MDDATKKIIEIAKEFDLNEYEDETYAEIEAMSGDYDVSPDDEIAAESMPLPAALTLIAGSKSEGFKFLQEVAEEKLAEFTAKSKNMTASQDSRSLFANMAMGVEQLLIEWGARVSEAKERLEKTTPDERQKIGNLDDLLCEEEPVADTRPVAPPSVKVQANTRAAQEWLTKGGK
jgi:hypothetical protein